jgi:hypothetical protein
VLVEACCDWVVHKNTHSLKGKRIWDPVKKNKDCMNRLVTSWLMILDIMMCRPIVAMTIVCPMSQILGVPAMNLEPNQESLMPLMNQVLSQENPMPAMNQVLIQNLPLRQNKTAWLDVRKHLIDV